MKKLFYLLMLAFLITGCNTTTSESSYEPLTTEVPTRPAGQKDVLGLTTPKMETVRVGFIGLGMRGPGAVRRFTHIPGVEIVALCDLHTDRVERTQKILENAGFPEAASYSGEEESWKELCDRDDID